VAEEWSDLPSAPGWGIYDWQQIVDGTVSLGMIYKVHAMYSSDTANDGGYDDTDYAALVELWDGRWATVHAGNDSTGWGCQGDYVDWRIFKTRDEAIAQGLTNESRRWLQLDLPAPGELQELAE
jgi:hypothetical protein